MKLLLRLPMIAILIVAALIGLGVIARVTGLWPAGEQTHSRPHQRVP